MLYVFLGTDRNKAREALNAAAKEAGGDMVRITDANSLGDFSSALVQGSSMFGGKRAVFFDGICASAEMRAQLLAALPHLASADENVFVYEERPDAEMKKALQKYAETVETFDLAKKKEYPSVFKLADALKSGDKKNLWVGYQRELAFGNAPEAIHGVLFWGAKQYLLAARGEKDVLRGRKLVAALAELPHESRRRGEELEYALERFILSFA